MKTAIKLILIYLGIQLICGGLIWYSFYYHCPYEWWERRCHPGFGVDIGSFDAAFHGSDVFLFMESTLYTQRQDKLVIHFISISDHNVSDRLVDDCPDGSVDCRHLSWVPDILEQQSTLSSPVG